MAIAPAQSRQASSAGLTNSRHREHGAHVRITNVYSKVSVVKADRNTPGFMLSPRNAVHVCARSGDRRGGGAVQLRRIDDTQKTRSPESPRPAAGGSNVTASVCSVLMKACDGIRAKLFEAAINTKDRPLSGRCRRARSRVRTEDLL